MYRNDKIRGRQAEKGWSNDQFAEVAGLHVNTISAIRTGRSVRTESLEKAATALGLTMAEVYEPRPQQSPTAAPAAA